MVISAGIVFVIIVVEINIFGSVCKINCHQCFHRLAFSITPAGIVVVNIFVI